MKTQTGNLLTVQSGILVHGCNCQGAMGAGIAGQIRKKYPTVYEAYVSQHRSRGLRLGDAQFVHNPEWQRHAAGRHLDRANATTELPRELIVVNAMTQQTYGNDPNVRFVDYDAVFAAFARIRLVARDAKLTVRFPLIGAGLANGDWAILQECIREGLGEDVFADAELWLLPGTTVPSSKEAA